MKIVKYGSEGLREKSKTVKNINSSYAELAANMVKMLKEAKGAGLAGPQVGVQEKIFVVNLNEEVPKIFINPSILETSEETSTFEEGCLSLPGVWEKVIRPEKVKVQAWNEKGRPFTVEAKGLYARIIQHECDHLEGVLFIDHLNEVKKARVIARYERKAKTNKVKA